MSLLSDPEARPGRWAQQVARLHRPVCLLLSIAALVWFCLLAHPFFNNSNYFSENALLPGLVRSDFVNDGSAQRYLNELNNEIEENYQHSDSIPIPWLVAKMNEINLDVYTHNFTLNYPLGIGKVFHGENVYGILRAGRSASTEALVLSAPYRPPLSQHSATNAGIALMLAFAKFAKTRKYWAKDIIILITEHEQLGAQAWLEAYHGSEASEDQDIRFGPFSLSESFRSQKVLDSGSLKGRAGAIQAAINLEFPELSVKYIDVKVEGLNGQLPNLDLVNLVHKMCIKSSMRHAYKSSYSWVSSQGPWKNWWNDFKTLFSMVLTQSTGVPTGNHGLFHRYGIEAVTMQGVEVEPFTKGGKQTMRKIPTSAHALEGTLRSLNNLLERFHQSFFFYLRPATDRFVSIGQYMPPLGILTGVLFIRAFAIWLTSQRTEIENINKKNSESKTDDSKETKVNKIEDNGFMYVGVLYLFMHLLGYEAMCAPQILSEIGVNYFELSTEKAIFYGLTIFSVAQLIFTPMLFNWVHRRYVKGDDVVMMHILALLELGTLVLTVGMHNFSLGFCMAVVYTPIALMIDMPAKKTGKIFSSFKRAMIKVTWLMLHPLVFSLIVICIQAAVSFPEEGTQKILNRGFVATQHAVTFSVVDSMIYGNWFFSVITLLLYPIWMLFWQILNLKAQ